MSKHLDKVREALDQAEWALLMADKLYVHEFADECRAALSALSAHEQEVAELVEALERSLNWLASYPGGGARNAYDQARAALRPFEDKK